MLASVVAVGCLLGAAPAALAQPGGGIASAGSTEMAWSARVWDTAATGHESDLVELLRQPAATGEPALRLQEAVALLEANLRNREATRLEQIEKVSRELDEHLAGEGKDLDLTHALESAVKLLMLSTDRAGFLAEARTGRLIREAEAAARKAEARADWFIASELFARLDALLEESGRFREDVRRQAQRLMMIRLYVPRRLWELRNERRIAEGEEPLPPYNPIGDDFNHKLKGISTTMVDRALSQAAQNHVDHEVDLGRMLRGGIEALRTMVNTPDLCAAFPGLRDEKLRSLFLGVLDREEGKLGGNPLVGVAELDSILQRVPLASEQTVRIPRAALLHEFGNGAMNALDEFSSIIWPDEMARFEKSTQGKFVGVGIQIQLSPQQQIQVVSPLDGTPAQRAGIRPDDVISKVNGESTMGFSLDQAVDVITGPPNTRVTLTIERIVQGEKQELDVELVRQIIDIVSVKGWRRTGVGEDQWDWFIDPETGIGYVRLSAFSEKTDAEFARAVEQMKAKGLNGLILDLRYNPGGLLDQAVAVVNRFVDPANARRHNRLVVSTHVKGDQVMQVETLKGGRTLLGGVPTVVLINEGSASASEIVSGALQDYAGTGAVQALVVGQRTYGKGSVQNVWALPGSAAASIKLTTQYYRLPGGRLVHKRPGATSWGVDPDLKIEVLTDQIAEALKIRQGADIVGIAGEASERPDPDDLIAKGYDLQLQYALVLLQSQALTRPGAQALLERR